MVFQKIWLHSEGYYLHLFYEFMFGGTTFLLRLTYALYILFGVFIVEEHPKFGSKACRGALLVGGFDNYRKDLTQQGFSF